MPLFKPNISALKDKRDIAGLIQAIKGGDARTRADAVMALGDVGDKRGLPILREVLQADGKNLADKVKAAEALGKLDDPAVVEALRQASQVSQQRERETIEEVTNSPERRYRAGFYVTSISSEELHLRATIAQALAKIGGASAVRALFDLLVSEHGAMESTVKNSVRAAIVDAAKRTGSAALPVLCEMLKHASVDARQWAAHCLAEFHEAQSIDALLRAAYDEHEDFEVRQTALTSLGQVGDARVLPYLEDLTDDKNRSIVRDAKQCAMSIRQRIKPASSETD